LPSRVSTRIERRRSSRVAFDPRRPVTEAQLARIVDAARWAPTAHNMQNFRLVVVDDASVLERLGRIVAPVSPLFIVENYHQLSRSPAELADRKVGLLGTMFPWWVSDPAKAPHVERVCHRGWSWRASSKRRT
jgi:nitroreductase